MPLSTKSAVPAGVATRVELPERKAAFGILLRSRKDRDWAHSVGFAGSKARSAHAMGYMTETISDAISMPRSQRYSIPFLSKSLPLAQLRLIRTASLPPSTRPLANSPTSRASTVARLAAIPRRPKSKESWA